MIELKKITKEYKGKEVLSEVSFAVDEGEKVALVGPNGAGKSTLLKIIAGEIESDQGKVALREGVTIGYLMQDLRKLPDMTIGQYLKKYVGIEALESEMEKLEAQGLTDTAVAARYGEVQAAYLHMGGYDFTHKAEAMLNGFGLDEKSLTTTLNELSVGQKTKIVITGILLKNPDILLLDEPTNNLDLPSIVWLQEYLRKSAITTIVISHDIAFLDAIVSKVAYLNWADRTIDVTRGSFSSYLERLHKEEIRKLQAYEEYVEEKDRLEKRAKELKSQGEKGSSYKGTDNDKFLRGFKRDQAARSGKQAKNIEKRIEQMEKVEKPLLRKELAITIDPQEKGGNIQLEDVVVGYDDFRIGPFSLTIPFGERVAIIGSNGAGKSTILRAIADSSNLLAGKIYKDARLHLGNFMQQHENLPEDQTVVEFLANNLPGKSKPELYSLLIKYGYVAEDADKIVAVLSPGQRARLLFALFSAKGVNTLILDEPSNHLDVEAIDSLAAVLETYEGTVIMVSHDRYLLEKGLIKSFYLVNERKVSYVSDMKAYITQAEAKAKKLLQTL